MEDTLLTTPKRDLSDEEHAAALREGGDDELIALASHPARLRNLDKSRLEEEEKELLEGQKATMLASIQFCAALQTKAHRTAA